MEDSFSFCRSWFQKDHPYARCCAPIPLGNEKRNLKTNIYVDSYSICRVRSLHCYRYIAVPWHIIFLLSSTYYGYFFFFSAISHFNILISTVFALLTFNLCVCVCICALFLSSVRGCLAHNAFYAFFCCFRFSDSIAFWILFQRTSRFFSFSPNWSMGKKTLWTEKWVYG